MSSFHVAQLVSLSLYCILFGVILLRRYHGLILIGASIGFLIGNLPFAFWYLWRTISLAGG